MAEAIGALRASAKPTDSTQPEKDRRTIEAMVSYLSAAARHPARRLRLPAPSILPRRVPGFRVRLATAVVASSLAFLLGVAYAGRLPAPAQNAVSVVLSKIGLSIPRHRGTGNDGQTGNHGNHGDTGSGVVPSSSPSPSESPGSIGTRGNEGNGNNGEGQNTDNSGENSDGQSQSGDEGNGGGGSDEGNLGGSGDGQGDQGGGDGGGSSQDGGTSQDSGSSDSSSGD